MDQESRNSLTGSFASVSLTDCNEVVCQGWGLIERSTRQGCTSKLTQVIGRIHFLTDFFPCWLLAGATLSSLSCGTLARVQLSIRAEYFIKISKEEHLLVRDFHLCYIITEVTPHSLYVRDKSQVL